ncbi:MAG: ABC transporter substrate-binding protein [Acidobacteria bacterium]|nr:ABC transporter substrate-binding protein [Acidobacteriota bacterium]
MRHFTLRRMIITVAGAMLGGLLLASGGRAEAQETLKARWAAAPPGFFATIVFVASERGFFKQEGVDVERVQFRGGGPARDALIAGEVDFADFVPSHVPLARLRQRPVKIIASLLNREFYSLIVREELRGRVTTLKDLKGLTIGATAPGSGAEVQLRRVLRRGGLDPARDVNIVYLGGLDTAYPAFRAGKVDALMMWQPAPAMAEVHRTGYTLFDFTDPEQHAQVVGAPEAMGYILATREEVIQKNPELVRRVIGALNRAAKWIHENPTEAIVDAVAKPYFPGVERDVVAVAIKGFLGSMPKDVGLSATAYRAAIEPLVEAKILSGMVPFAEAVDTRFAGERK